MIIIHFESALLIAVAPAIITSLIDGIGEWSNSRNFKKEKALDAIRSFRRNVGNKINGPSNNYSNNLKQLNNDQLQQLVLFINQWAVYINSRIALKQIIYNAISYELVMTLSVVFPTASELRRRINVEEYFKLISDIGLI